jgi:quinol monooxygenase YgiN
MILVRIILNLIPENQKEVTQTLLSLIEPTCREKGCISYRAYQDIEDPTIFNLIEEWRSRQYLDDHIRSDKFAVLLGTRSLLAKPLEIKIHKVSHSEGMEAVKTARGKGVSKR